MKLALALISALILMDYAAAAPGKQPSSYAPNEDSMELGYERVEELVEAGRKQNIQSNPHNDNGLQLQRTQRKIYYPTAVMGDKRQNPTTYNYDVDPPMTTGAVEAVFKTPIMGVNNLYLLNAENDELLRVYAHFDIQSVGLNSKPHDGEYGDWVFPRGFPFPCCGYVTILTMRVDITPNAFILSVNGLEIQNYPFRPELRPPVDRVTFDIYSTHSELVSMVLDYTGKANCEKEI